MLNFQRQLNCVSSGFLVGKQKTFTHLTFEVCVYPQLQLADFFRRDLHTFWYPVDINISVQERLCHL